MMKNTSKTAAVKVRGWDPEQVRRFVYEAIKANREAWDLVPSLRTAIIAAKFTAIVTGQSSESIATAKLDNLWADMQDQARKWGME